MTVLGKLLTQLNDASKQIVRSREKVKKKLVNVRNAVIFNETYIYIYIYIYISRSEMGDEHWRGQKRDR